MLNDGVARGSQARLAPRRRLATRFCVAPRRAEGTSASLAAAARHRAIFAMPGARLPPPAAAARHRRAARPAGARRRAAADAARRRSSRGRRCGWATRRTRRRRRRRRRRFRRPSGRAARARCACGCRRRRRCRARRSAPPTPCRRRRRRRTPPIDALALLDGPAGPIKRPPPVPAPPPSPPPKPPDLVWKLRAPAPSADARARQGPAHLSLVGSGGELMRVVLQPPQPVQQTANGQQPLGPWPLARTPAPVAAFVRHDAAAGQQRRHERRRLRRGRGGGAPSTGRRSRRRRSGARTRGRTARRSREARWTSCAAAAAVKGGGGARRAAAEAGSLAGETPSPLAPRPAAPLPPPPPPAHTLPLASLRPTTPGASARPFTCPATRRAAATASGGAVRQGEGAAGEQSARLRQGERRTAARPLLAPLASPHTTSLCAPLPSRSLHPPAPRSSSLRSATRARCSGTTPTGTGWRASRSTSATPPASSPPPTARCAPRILRWRGRCCSMNRSRRAGARIAAAAAPPVVVPAAALPVSPIPYPAPSSASQVGRSAPVALPPRHRRGQARVARRERCGGGRGGDRAALGPPGRRVLERRVPRRARGMVWPVHAHTGRDCPRETGVRERCRPAAGALVQRSRLVGGVPPRRHAKPGARRIARVETPPSCLPRSQLNGQ